MCYNKKDFSRKALAALAFGIMFSGSAMAADSDATIDLGFDDEFGISADELGTPEAPQPQLSIDKNADKGGLLSPAQGIVPKTGAAPIVPKTGNAPIVPKTGEAPIVPKTGALPGGIVPKTGAQPGAIVPKTGVVPKTGAAPIVPKTGNAPIVPKTGEAPIVPKTGALPGGIVPKTGAQPGAIVPKTGALPGGIVPKTGLLPPEQGTPKPAPQPAMNVLEELDDEIFSQMTDIEKQTAILSLELRKEKLKNEIEAIKAQRLKAQNEVVEKEEAEKLKRQEWEKEQERKIIEEQIKLRKVEIAYEKIRQEGLLNAYKEDMLKEQQRWIENNAGIYEQIAHEKKDREEFTKNVKERLTRLMDALNKANEVAETTVENHKREVNELQTQISILKARLEAEKKTNPFADGQQPAAAAAEPEEDEEEELRISDLYVVMEITGQGDELIAKLMNRDGQTFLTKVGTTLQTGQKVDEIGTTHVRVDKNGVKDYLYFSAGGVIDKEPLNGAAKALEKAAEEKNKLREAVEQPRKKSVVSSRGIPGVSKDMMLR